MENEMLDLLNKPTEVFQALNIKEIYHGKIFNVQNENWQLSDFYPAEKGSEESIIYCSIWHSKEKNDSDPEPLPGDFPAKEVNKCIRNSQDFFLQAIFGQKIASAQDRLLVLANMNIDQNKEPFFHAFGLEFLRRCSLVQAKYETVEDITASQERTKQESLSFLLHDEDGPSKEKASEIFLAKIIALCGEEVFDAMCEKTVSFNPGSLSLQLLSLATIALGGQISATMPYTDPSAISKALELASHEIMPLMKPEDFVNLSSRLKYAIERVIERNFTRTPYGWI